MKKLTVNEQEELFAQDCKLINLRYEYSGFTGTEKWAIITELSEEALWDKYPDVISRYTPFILLSMAQGEVISESHRNNDKYEKRSKRTIDVYGYEDDIFEQFHPKSIAPFIDPFDKAEEEQIEEEKEKLRQLELSKVRQALSMLDDEDIEMQKHDFITLYQGADYYGLGLKVFTRMAREAGSVYKIGKKALIRRTIFDEYLRKVYKKELEKNSSDDSGKELMKRQGTMVTDEDSGRMDIRFGLLD